MKEEIIYRPAGPVVHAFHQSDAFIKGIMGPVGSSKSSACIMDLVVKGQRQAPDAKGSRWSKWLVCRSTFPELKSTTIRTFQDWFPYAKFKWDSPITAWLDYKIADGTRVQSEWIFLPIERPEDVGKLKSFEATGEGKLTMTVAVRESAIAQTITSTASLEAPKRESGKRLIVSEPISVVIVKSTGKNEGGLENGGGEATEATKASIENANRENEMKPSPVQPTTSPPKRGLLQSESLWTSIAFLGAATLLLFGFVTGRLSKRDKKKLQ